MSTRRGAKESHIIVLALLHAPLLIRHECIHTAMLYIAIWPLPSKQGENINMPHRDGVRLIIGHTKSLSLSFLDPILFIPRKII